MLSERVLRNLGSQVDHSRVDWVDVDWNELGRVLKKQSRSGQPVRVLLSPGQKLRHGDVVAENEQGAIAIFVRPTEVMVAHPRDAREMAMLALELGNLHWPTQATHEELIFVEDGPVLAVIEKYQVPFTRESRRFEPEPINYGVRISANLQIIRGPSGAPKS